MGLLTLLGRLKLPKRRDADVKVTTDFYQWLSVKGTKIVRNAFADNSIVTLFTVPNDEAFFLTSAFIHVKTNVLNAGAVAEIDAGGEKILVLESSNTDEETTSLTQNYPIPLQIDERIIITLQASATGQFANGGLTGFTISKSELARAKKDI